MRAQAVQLGFDLCRVTSPGSIPDAPGRLAAWLEAEHHGTMDWMAANAPRRADPRVLWPQVRSIVMLGVNYGPAVDPRAVLADRQAGAISVYARGRDYHDVIKGKLKQLASWLLAAGRDGEVKVFVDTAPVLEKPLAAAAGIGWQGRHTNLVSREFGSWLFLGSIFTTLALRPDGRELDHCGSCRACLDACPTDAFPAPYQLDARRCISYLTIEHQGVIPRAFRHLIGNRIYGCDDCLAACPWNKFASAGREIKLASRDDLLAPRLDDLVTLDDARFRLRFAGGPIKRIGRDRFIRNVLIAIGNSGDVALMTAVREKLDDPSPQVRAAAVWAASRLLDAAAFAELSQELRGRETRPRGSKPNGPTPWSPCQNDGVRLWIQLQRRGPDATAPESSGCRNRPAGQQG